MAKKVFPLRPTHPERVCWGCDNYCAARDMICGNGTERTQHPIELEGEAGSQPAHDVKPAPQTERGEDSVVLSRAQEPTELRRVQFKFGD